ncbi:MAG: hypothetical protein JWQ49_6054 [Edaphobacter sp.]|nr:hypothetical protein [Edaphobacter sp.]
MCVCVVVVFPIVANANANVAHIWTRRNTFGGKTLEIYFDTEEGVSANSRFMARGESPTERRMWRARWL